jgi:benzoyl-CoA reductase/2-hydroxyglutaryl-CoA dehydratase subunit BcrC/BadD/HgdB
MRRVYDLLAESSAPKFLFNLPHTWETPAAQKLYQSELLRLGDFLVSLGGTSPTLGRLRDVMLEYDDARTALRDAHSRISPRRYSELIAAARQELRPPDDIYIPSGVPLALVGGPLQSDRFDLFDMIEKAGGYVALDATETGERTLPAPLDRRLLSEDPMSALVDAYFGTIPDAFRRPNTELYRWLKVKLPERGIRGILFYRYLWCDTWHAEAQRLKEWSGLPFFDLDIGDDTSDFARTTSRLQSFMEMLR